jgi:tetratricopeptide (TPR) repeat protein
MRINHVLLAGLLLCVSFSSSAITQQELKSQLESRDKKALPNAEAYAKANPNNADAQVLLTRARLQAGKPESAVDAAQKAVKLAPNNAQAQFWLGNAYGSQINNVGMMSKMSMAPKLRDAFEKTVQLDPNNLDAREALLQFYVQAPSVVGGGKDKAQVQAREIAKRDPARGHLAQAQIYLSDNNTAAALKSYEAAYAAKPGDANIRLAIGIAYQQASRWNDAFKHFRAWVAQDDKAGVAWYQIGRTSALSGQLLDEGISALKKYLGMPHGPNEPQNKNAYYRLGQLYAKAGRKAEAKTAFQSALKLDPGYKEAKTELAKL